MSNNPNQRVYISHDVCRCVYLLAVIAVRESVAGFPHLKGDENIILLDNLEDMEKSIVELRNDYIKRKKLGENAKKTFDEHLTWKGQTIIIKGLVDKLIDMPV